MPTVYSRILCFMPKTWLLYLPGPGPGVCRAVLFQPQASGSRGRQRKHTKRLRLSCLVCATEEVDARETPGLCLLLELLCGSSTSLSVKAGDILHPLSGRGISSTLAPFSRNFWVFVQVSVWCRGVNSLSIPLLINC